MKHRREVDWFADQMERVLQAHDDKGHWSNCPIEYLLRRLREEVAELEANPSDIDEAIDVANFAMMIADASRRERIENTLYAEGLRVEGEAQRLRTILARLVTACEDFASSEPAMPSHHATECEFDAALDVARLAARERP